MTRYANNTNKSIEPILKETEEWKVNCLLGGGSVFQPELRLWTAENVTALKKVLSNSGLKKVKSINFASEIEPYLASASAEVQKLVAEMFWIQYVSLYQAPTPENKRNAILQIWSWSGGGLGRDDPHLTDELFRGAARPGTAFYPRCWEEFQYLVSVCGEFLALEETNRKEKLGDAFKFSEWLTDVSGSNTFQTRHILLFLLFPEEMERIYNRNHREIIAGTLNPDISLETIERMPPHTLDRLLFETRKRLEQKYDRNDLDWYDPPLDTLWPRRSKKSQKADPNSDEATSENNAVKAAPEMLAKNIIFYGPPGTGKTRRLNLLRQGYIDQEEQTDEVDLVSLFESWKLRWWEVVALALGDFERQERNPRRVVGEICDHPYVIAQSKRRSDNPDDFNFRAVVPGTLRSHRVGGRNRIQIFHWHSEDKDRKQGQRKGEWSLIQSWREEVPDLAKRLAQLQSGTLQLVHGIASHRVEYVTFHQSYSYEDFVEGIRPVQDEDSEGVIYRVEPGVFRRICARARSDPGHRYAMFIDEINRGNISKIFGELITLLEPDKRARYDKDGNRIGGMELTLPYSGDLFGVPENLDMYGAMNTADRSIALLDTALRRRFEFEELRPDADIIPGADGEGNIEDGEGGSIDLRQLLESMNRRIRFLLDREHMIGHSYFMDIEAFADLRRVLTRKVLPLLQEYFYEDWSRIQLVLRDRIGENRNSPQIIRDEPMEEMQVLGFDHDDYEDKVEYERVEESKITPAAVRKIYET